MKSPRIPALIALALGVILAVGIPGCSSTRPVQSQKYAQLHGSRTFEYDFPTVWKGIEAALRNHKIAERDPEEVDPLEMRKLTRRDLETEWFYGQSRDKYQTYEVNGSPRKVYLQTRLKFFVEAQKMMGGVNVMVTTEEEVETLKDDGSPDDWEKPDKPDPSRANELLDKIQQAILSAAP